jgi:Putative metal-binding motif
MHRVASAIALALALCSTGAVAQPVSDHLRCWKVKDPVKLKGVVDLDSAAHGLDAGCKISKTVLYCTPATKTVVEATNQATKTPIDPLPVTGSDPGARVCYKVVCPKREVPSEIVTDQFGNRTLVPGRTSMLCTPAVTGVPTTTTSSTSTTTLPGCTDADLDSFCAETDDCDDGNAGVYPGAPEACNGVDDDCDPGTPDGSADAGAPCDGADGDQCAEGTLICIDGSPVCSDVTGTSSELCNGVDDDCDTQIDEDFPRDDNPVCLGGLFDLGTVSGDTGSGVLNDSFHNEEWDLIHITENNDGVVYLSATIMLESPPGVDFDLYVYCAACGAPLAASSTVHGLGGHFDSVHVRTDDDFGVDDDFDVVIEVRHVDSTICAPWTLTVTGNTSVSTETCG